MEKETINKDLINIVGLDRVRFITDIESISVNTFIANKGYITYSCNDDNKYTIVNNDDSKNISFDSLRYKVEISTFNKTSDRTIYEVKTISYNSHRRIAVDIVLGRYKYGTKHNAYVVNAEEVKELMEQLHGELLEIGLGLKSPNTWTISYIELNKTIESDKPLLYYDRALTWLLECVYGSIDDNIHISTDRTKYKKAQSLTYTIHWDYKNDNRIDSIYSKTEQIKQSLDIVLDGNLIRFESKYSDKEIINTFGTYNAYEILATKLEKLFNGSVQHIADIVNKSIETDIQYYYELLERPNVSSIDNLYRTQHSDIFDIVIMLEAIRRKYKDNNNSHFSRDINISILKGIDTKEQYNYESLVDILTAFYPKVKLFKFNKSVMKYSTKNNANN